MGTELHIISRSKLAVHVWLVIVYVFICQYGFCQNYTSTDSILFQAALNESHSDADRIRHQLELADYSIRKPGSTESDFANARSWISLSKKINEKIKSKAAEGHILLEECLLAERSGRTPKSKSILEAAVTLLQNNSDKCLLATAYKALSDHYDADNPEQKNKKIELIKLSLMNFNYCGNKLEEGLTLLDLSETYLATGSFSLALKTLNESQELLLTLHYKRLQRLYNLFGIYYLVRADYQKCLQYQFKSLEVCKQLKDSSELYCEVNNIIGMSFMDLEQNVQAIPYLKKALELSKKNKYTSNVFSISINLSIALSSLNKLKESLKVLDDLKMFTKGKPFDPNNKITFYYSYLGILLKLHQYGKAESYAKELRNLITQPSVNRFGIANAYHILTKYYYAIKNYDEALTYLVRNEKFLEKAGVPWLHITNLSAWYAIDSARKDYKNAFFHLLKYKKLNDSIFTEKQSQQIQQLQVKYETQKKEDEIKLLTQNSKMHEVQLKAAQLTRNLTLAGILIFILIAGIQYRRYREKQKVNLLVTEKNAALQQLVKEKEWLLKEIHHRVKNNLHTVICLLESQAVYLENDALKAVENSRHRIYAMSLIHQKLYQSDDIKVVDMNIYLTEFVEYLRESFGSPEHIQVILNAEKIKLGANQAVPIGLIINESVTNAFKYAFPLEKKGEIKIELKRVEDEIYLTVTDTGIGFKHQAEKEINSLGLELIKGLALDLRGTINFETDTGTSIHIHFKIEDVGSIT